MGRRKDTELRDTANINRLEDYGFKVTMSGKGGGKSPILEAAKELISKRSGQQSAQEDGTPLLKQGTGIFRLASERSRLEGTVQPNSKKTLERCNSMRSQ